MTTLRVPSARSLVPGRLAAPAIAVVMIVAASPIVSAQSIHPNKLKGRWTTVSAADWGAIGKGTHMALLRGNADTTWLMHWDAHDGNDPRLWLVKPETDTTF